MEGATGTMLLYPAMKQLTLDLARRRSSAPISDPRLTRSRAPLVDMVAARSP